jgi:hypothetical protein
MKTFFITLTIFILFAGCSSKNAFDQFELDKKQELSISSLQTSKILSKTGEVEGIFSAIYLNEVYPESFNEDEYFFVYTFMKNSKEMYNPQSSTQTDLVLKLNSKLPIKLKKLPKNNRFSKLVSIKSAWNNYYLVAFEKDDIISLTLENASSSSTPLNYQKY